MVVKRGDIYYADLRPVVGSEQGGVRPVLIIQNDMGNRYSPTVICAAITSKMNKAKLPTHIALNSEDYGIVKDSVILLEQVRTIDKSRLREKVCHLDESVMRRIKQGLEVAWHCVHKKKPPNFGYLRLRKRTNKKHLWEEVFFVVPYGT